MIQRPFWIKRIEAIWEKALIVWLTGVRRVGKTTLCKNWPEASFLNCDLPRVREQLEDPEFFFSHVEQKIVILDEIHQTENPSEILKIGADEFPHLRILATGSSTLSATRKFRDSLTGRKRNVLLRPVLATELSDFHIRKLEDRLKTGGLPDCALGKSSDAEFYSEWLDSYFARDVQELFSVGKRRAFLDLAELLMRQSGQLLEVTSLAKHCGISRPTVMQYLDILELTHVVHLVRPFHGGSRREIVAQPKAYAFDTGFVCHFRSWEQLRPEDCGQLLEHLVLDLLQSHLPDKQIHYWRDKQQREIDFVIVEANNQVTTIECKWKRSEPSRRNLDAFRALYPKGRNLVVTAQQNETFKKKLGPHIIEFWPIYTLPDALSSQKSV
jgi:predicted AAA+ superfamily ATPase